MRFRVKLLARDGSLLLRELEAGSAEEASALLAEQGFACVAVQSVRQSLFAARSSFRLTVFSQQLCALLAAGQSIVDSIEILERNDATRRGGTVFTGLLLALRQGKTFSDAMALQPSVFPPLLIAMVKSSETTGSVLLAMRRFLKYQEQIAQIRSKLMSAAVYPFVLIGVGLLVVSFLLFYVVPRFSLAFDSLPDAGKTLGGFVFQWGGFVRNRPELAWGALIGSLALLVCALLHPRTRLLIRAGAMRIPAIGTRLRIFHLSRLYRTLGLLLRSGVPLTSALAMAREAMPALYKEPLLAVRRSVEEGLPLSSALGKQGLSTEIALRLVVAGESSGNLYEMLEHVADFHDEEVASWVDMGGRLIEPLLMVAIGGIIGFIVLLLYMPIFELANSVQ